MPAIYLIQPEFTYSTCGPFTKAQKKSKNTKEQEIHYIYRNKLDKACSQHEMAYGDFKDLTKRAVPNKVLHDKAFNIAKNPKWIEKGSCFNVL